MWQELQNYKARLQVDNKTYWDTFLDGAYDYILGLKNADGQLMHTMWQKTGFIGFIAATNSIKGLSHDLTECTEAPMKYLLI